MLLYHQHVTVGNLQLGEKIIKGNMRKLMNEWTYRLTDGLLKLILILIFLINKP